MSGSQTTTASSGGQSVSALQTAAQIKPDDRVLGIFGGVVLNATVRALVAAGLPDTITTNIANNPDLKSQIEAVLSKTNFNQLVSDAAAHAQQAGDAQQLAAASEKNAATAAKNAQQFAETIKNLISSAGSSASSNAQNSGFRISSGVASDIPFTWRGWWDSKSNNPTLKSGQGTAGDAYIVLNDGTTTLDGNAQWQPFDVIYYTGQKWVRGASGGLPIAAQRLYAQTAVQIDKTQLTNGVNPLEITDDLGFTLAHISSRGNIKTAGDKITFGSTSLNHAGDGWHTVLTDPLGFIAWGVDDSGALRLPKIATQGDLGPISVEHIDDGLSGVQIVDQRGFVALDTTGTFASSQGVATQVSDPNTFTRHEIALHDQANLARSALLQSRIASSLYAAPTWNYSICDSSGQSELGGWVSLPPRTLNTPASLGALMLGNCVYGLGGSDSNPNPNFIAAGGSTLQPIVGTSYNYVSDQLFYRPAFELCFYQPASLDFIANGNTVTVTTTDQSVDFTKGVYSQSSGKTGSCPGLQVNDNVQIGGFTGDLATNNLSSSPYGFSQVYKVNSVKPKELILEAYNPAGNPGFTAPKTATGVSGVSIQILWGGLFPYIGEAQCVQASVSFRKAQLDARGTDRDDARQLVTFCSAIGGKGLYQLSKGRSPDIYNRGVSAVQQIAAIAKAEGKSCGCYLIEWLQGGSDQSTHYEDYLRDLGKYHDDKNSDYAAITGQTRPARMEIAVLSQENASMFEFMSVQRAQVDYVLQNPDKAYCIGAMYPAQDYYAHGSSNAEVWTGAMRAKFRDAVYNRGRMPTFVCMRKATARGSQLLIDFQAPCPPLTLRSVWTGEIQQMLPTYGFAVVDASGNDLGISSVRLVGDLTVLIEVGQVIPAGAWVMYAPSGYNCYGSGNIFDSDPAQSLTPYSYTQGDGTPLPEQVAALNGKPMSLANPAVPYALKIQQENNT